MTSFDQVIQFSQQVRVDFLRVIIQDTQQKWIIWVSIFFRVDWNYSNSFS